MSSTGVERRYASNSGHWQNSVCISSTALLTAFKKWTFDLLMTRAASWRHIFETNMNLFALIPQVHSAKPLDNLVQQASIRQG